ncbi:MAG TPA: dTMP kinase, partial [Deltaproteobacteria bacterium]|nr:dTMP kinase [Deltaproteobacteria bacterium]
MIISFEGGEGVGKTTQIRLLSSYLEKEHIPWVSIREPGGSPISERIRSLFLENDLDPRAELLLVLASRRVNIKKVIEPALSEGNIVIIDRFLDSTLVYQGILGDID